MDKQIRIDERGQTQVRIADGDWEDCSLEEFNELLNGGYELICSETTN